MKRTISQLVLIAAAALALAVGAAACSGGGDSGGDKGDDDSGSPTPTPVINPYEVCVAHFEENVGDAPEIANLLFVVMLSEYWVGAPPDIAIDGLDGAIYADYHYNFSGPNPPEYVGAISTDGTVTVTSSNNLLGTTAQLDIAADPIWSVTTGTASTMVTGGAGTVSGVLQPLSDCPGGPCVYGTGSVALAVNGSSLTIGTGSVDGISIIFCRDLPAAFSEWRPGAPLPPGFREAFR